MIIYLLVIVQFGLVWLISAPCGICCEDDCCSHMPGTPAGMSAIAGGCLGIAAWGLPFLVASLGFFLTW